MNRPILSRILALIAALAPAAPAQEAAEAAVGAAKPPVPASTVVLPVFTVRPIAPFQMGQTVRTVVDITNYDKVDGLNVENVILTADDHGEFAAAGYLLDPVPIDTGNSEKTPASVPIQFEIPTLQRKSFFQLFQPKNHELLFRRPSEAKLSFQIQYKLTGTNSTPTFTGPIVIATTMEAPFSAAVIGGVFGATILSIFLPLYRAGFRGEWRALIDIPRNLICLAPMGGACAALVLVLTDSLTGSTFPVQVAIKDFWGGLIVGLFIYKYADHFYDLFKPAVATTPPAPPAVAPVAEGEPPVAPAVAPAAEGEPPVAPAVAPVAEGEPSVAPAVAPVAEGEPPVAPAAAPGQGVSPPTLPLLG